MTSRSVGLALRASLLLLLVAGFAVSPAAQDLLPLERTALAAKAAGQPVAAANALLELATATAATPGDAVAAARVEAWVTQATSLLESTPELPVAAIAGLRDSPLAQSHPMLRDRLGIALLTLVANRPGPTAAALASDTGAIAGFWLVGPFDNERGAGYRTALEPERGLDLDAEYQGKRRTTRWRRLPLLPGDGTLQLAPIVHPHEQSLVYAACAVHADAPMQAILELGTTGSFRVFCNGAEVGSREVERALRADQDAIAVPLQRGANLLVLKLCHQEGDEFACMARLRAIDGAPASGLRTSAEPADLRLAAAVRPSAPATDPVAIPLGARSTWPIDGARGADALRLAWLWQARAADGDLERRDLAAAQRAVAELPQLAESHLLLAAARTSQRRSEADRDDNERRRAFEAALAIDGKHVEALVGLGELLATGSGLWREARSLAERALAVAPQSGSALLLWRQTMAEEGLAAMADARLLQAASGKGAELALLRYAADVLRERAPDRALQLSQQVLATSRAPADLESATKLMLRLGQTGPALQTLQQAIGQDAFAWGLRGIVAEHLLAKGDPRGALQQIEAWLQIAPDDAEAMVFASRCWRQLVGSADDAATQQLALLRSALEVEPNRRDDERYAEFLAAAASGDAEPFYTAYRRDGAELLRQDPGAPVDAAAARDPLHWILRQRVLRANGNGTTNDYLHQIVRVLTEDGARQLAYYRLPYWGGEQRARLLSCTITRPDGTVQRPTLRGAGVAMPNLRPGDVVDLEGRIDDIAPSFFGDYFGLVHAFAANEGSPVRQSELIVLADPGRTYRHQSSNGAPAAEETTLPDGTRRFHWLLHDLPRDVAEIRRPDRLEYEPVVRMTTYRDWDHFASWWWNLIKNQLEVTPSMRATVQQLVAGLPTTEAKIAAIYRFVTTDVRYEAWEFGVHGYKPYSTAVIHERRHGDCKDKALLLCALLGEIGVPCQPVLIFADPTRRKDDLELAMVQQFNHCIAWLPPHEGKPGRFLDGTATWHPTDTLPEMDQGADVLVVDNGKADLRTVPWTTPQQNRTQDEFQVTLRPDGSADVAVRYRPLGNSAIELRSMIATEPARRREQLERRLVGTLGKLELRDLQASDGLDLGAPVDVAANAALGELGQRTQDRWQLPSAWLHGDLQQLANEPERRTPLLLGVPSGDQQTVRYRIPAGWRSGDLPAPVQKQAPFGTFSMQWQRQGDQIVVERTLEFSVPRIVPKDYAAFRDFVAAVKAADAQLVLLQKEAGR